MKLAPLHGLVAATFTPQHANGSLNLGLVAPMVDYLIDRGIAGLYVCGSTGEGPLLTTLERQQVAEAYVKANRGRLPVMVHVGHASIEESCGLAQHAASIGVDRISATAPYYFKPGSVKVLADGLAKLASAAPQLPFYYYHIPSLVGVQLDIVALLAIAKERIPNFAGIKYTAPTMTEFHNCLMAAKGEFDCLFGLDELLLQALSIGTKGAIGSTYNLAAPIYLKVIAAYEKGDMAAAQAHFCDAVRMVNILIKYGGMNAIKATMQFRGFDCGPCRLPLETVQGEKLAALRSELAEIGFFDWV